MVTLEKFGNSAVKFGFENNSLYLNNGEITVPLNSLMLVIDNSELATFKKLNGDPFVSVSYSDLGMSKSELEAWYKNNMVGGGGLPTDEIQEMIDESISGKADTSALTVYFGAVDYDSNTKRINFYNQSTSGEVLAYVDASDFIVDGMIDDVRIETISGASYLVIDFNTASGKEDIMIPISDIFDASNYYTKAETDSAITASVSGKADTTAVTADIAAAVSGKADTSAVTFSEDFMVIGEKTGQTYFIYQKGNTIYVTKEDTYIDNITVYINDGNGDGVEITLNDSGDVYTYNSGNQSILDDFSIERYGYLPNSFKLTQISNLETYYYLDGYYNCVFYAATFTIPSGTTDENAIKILGNEHGKSIGDLYDSKIDGIGIGSGGVDSIAFYSRKNGGGSDYQYVYLDGGLTISGDGQGEDLKLSTKVPSSTYKWMSADTTSDSCYSSKFNVPSSAITFDMSRNPTTQLNWCYNGSYDGLIDSNGDNLSPQLFSIVNDNGHVTVTVISNIPIDQISDEDCELDQYISNLQYWGCETDTIPNVVNTLFASKVDVSAITSSVTSASTDSQIPTAKAVFDAIPSGGSVTIDPTLDSGSTNAVANSAITAAFDDVDARLGEDEEVTAAALNALEDELANKQDVLVAGSGITIDSANTISCTVEGGATYSAGTNIQITTANTINCTLPLSNGGGTSNIALNGNHAFKNNPTYTTILGYTNESYGNSCQLICGSHNIAYNNHEVTFGHYNVSRNGSTSADKTILTIGDGSNALNRHNAFEVRQNGDIYISSGGTDIKLQDNLGGGTVDASLDSGSTNAVANSAITTAFNNIEDRLGEDEEVTAAGLNAVNDKFGGLRIVKLTQQEYDALVTKDNNTMYVVV